MTDAKSTEPIRLRGAWENDETAAREFDHATRDINFVRLLRTPSRATRWLIYIYGGLMLAGYAYAAWVIEPRFGAPSDWNLPAVVVGAKINESIWAGEWWRLITHTFLHGGLVHLLFNGYGLYVLGSLAERLFGPTRFIVLYGTSAITGALATFFFNASPSVGASGAIFGLFGAVIVYGYRNKHVLPQSVSRTLTRGLAPWLLFSLAFGLFPMVDNAAHFGGLAGGTLAAFAVSSPLARICAPRPKKHAVLVFVAALLTGLAVASFALAGVHAASCVESEEAWGVCVEPMRAE